MVLAAAIAFLLCLSPHLEASLPQKIQQGWQIFLVGACALQLLAELARGRLLLPASTPFRAWLLLFFSLYLSASLSLLPSAAMTPAGSWALGFLLFPLLARLSGPQRIWTDRALLLSGWGLLAVAFTLKLADQPNWQTATLINPNILAGLTVMLIPLSVERRSWLLTAMLSLLLLKSQSLAAWICLPTAALAAFYPQAGKSRRILWTLLAGAVGLSLLLYSHPSLAHRQFWWRAAWELFQESPLWGTGPGSYPYLFPAVRSRLGGIGLSTPYAHNYPLQVLCELGILFSLLWFSWILRSLTRLAPARRWAVLAALLFGLSDSSLLLPSHHWIFCYLLSGTESPPSSSSLSLRTRTAGILLVLACALSLPAFWKNRTSHPSQDFRSASEHLARHLKMKTPSDLHLALAYQKLATEKNPYRAQSWIELAWLYGRAANPEKARQALRAAQQLDSQHPALRTLRKKQ